VTVAEKSILGILVCILVIVACMIGILACIIAIITMILHPKYRGEVIGKRCAVLFQLDNDDDGGGGGGGEERQRLAGTIAAFQFHTDWDDATNAGVSTWHHQIDFDNGDSIDYHLETLEFWGEFWWLDRFDDTVFLDPAATAGVARARIHRRGGQPRRRPPRGGGVLSPADQLREMMRRPIVRVFWPNAAVVAPPPLVAVAIPAVAALEETVMSLDVSAFTSMVESVF
jgi:hypothetical protein